MVKKGFTLIELMIVIAIIAIIAAIAIPNLIEARKHANEAAAIGALRTLTTAQSIFREADKEIDGTFDYGTLIELGQTELIDEVFSAGTKQGYSFSVQGLLGEEEYVWFGNGDPVLPDKTGDRYFYINETGVIFFSLVAPIVNNGSDTDPTTGTALGTK